MLRQRRRREMEEKRNIILLLFVLLTLTVSAQKTREQMGGVYYAYPSVQPSDGVTAPAGYAAFYISHYGRHGSRWLPSDERYQWVMSQFADKKNLTKTGKQVRGLMKKVWKNARGHGGLLTPLGGRQHQEIAQRMVAHYPEVFTDETVVLARSSVVDRCRKSMLAFTDELRRLCPPREMTVETDSAFMAYIAYTTPELKQLECKVFPRMKGSPDRFISQLFIHPEAVVEKERLMSELHTIASDMQDVELPIQLYDIFTDEEFADIYERNNDRMVYCNGTDIRNEGIPALSAVTLWQDIEQRADEAIGKSAPSATLRFGHDTNLYRLLTLLQTESSLTGKMDEILPMAANLQMIFYHNEAGDVIVRLLHNERPTTIPIQVAFEGGFYRWDDLKTFVARRIHRLHHLHHLHALNTMVGTAQANTRTAGLFGKGSEEHGQTLPAVLTPNGQNFWTPQTQDTEQKCIAPYYYKDTLFQGVRNSHWIVGGCTQDYGSFTISAISGALRTQPKARATRFSHSDEVSHPDYYSVRLPDEHLLIELTASSHGAILRITPDRDQLVHVLLNPNSDEGEGGVTHDPARHEIYGYNPVHRIYQGWGERAGFSGHLLLRYDQQPLSAGTYDELHATEGQQTLSGKTNIGAILTFQGKAGEPILLRMASSFTDREGCQKNMEAEIEAKTFEEVQSACSDQWIDRLHTIDVSEEDTARVNQFYGALYRASFLPRELSDVDGAYPRFADGTKTNRGRRCFTDFSMWDTYRALHPLYHIIEPDLSADMMQSLVNMYEEGGWLPIFPCWNSYTAAMIGDHCAVALADAYIKGVRGFDYEKAYEAMRKNAFESPARFEDYQNGMGRRALQSYLKYGYIPLEDSVKEAFHNNEQTSRTLEYAFDDFAVAQMAKALGHEADYQELMRRSENWRNVINPRTGYADGRHSNGRFENNTDLVHRKDYITEGATCHYTWYVPHNPQGLMEVMGGRDIFVNRLDSMFTEGRYWHGNEPCHQIAWMYDYAGEPEKTQHWVRHILETEYNDTPGGLSGNDDAGQMSAWYLFAAMGFYPVCPATNEYVHTKPLFMEVRINVERGER